MQDEPAGDGREHAGAQADRPVAVRHLHRGVDLGSRHNHDRARVVVGKVQGCFDERLDVERVVGGQVDADGPSWRDMPVRLERRLLAGVVHLECAAPVLVGRQAG